MEGHSLIILKEEIIPSKGKKVMQVSGPAIENNF